MNVSLGRYIYETVKKVHFWSHRISFFSIISNFLEIFPWNFYWKLPNKSFIREKKNKLIKEIHPRLVTDKRSGCQTIFNIFWQILPPNFPPKHDQNNLTFWLQKFIAICYTRHVSFFEIAWIWQVWHSSKEKFLNFLFDFQLKFISWR